MKTKNIGIWLNRHKAIIYVPTAKTIIEVISKLEDANPISGNSGSRSYHAHHVISESTISERREQQLNRYFTEIMDRLPAAKHIYIMGPGEVKLHFQKALNRRHNFRDIETTLEPADSLTLKQIKTQVHNFFESKYA